VATLLTLVVVPVLYSLSQTATPQALFEGLRRRLGSAKTNLNSKS